MTTAHPKKKSTSAVQREPIIKMPYIIKTWQKLKALIKEYSWRIQTTNIILKLNPLTTVTINTGMSVTLSQKAIVSSGCNPMRICR